LSIDLRHLQVVHERLERSLYRDIGLQTIGVGLSYRFPQRRQRGTAAPPPSEVAIRAARSRGTNLG
jgi:hypothetical protein